MAAMNANTSLMRSRSLRGAASNTIKPSPTPQLVSSGPSHVALFLTSLRLLDLDQRDDWPDITVLTFSTKDSQQSSKRRVQCVEWALYQLFALWDPEETRNKLQPFFPPLEQLQSLNLRAALFRCLDHAKKTGMLGRDAVLRKTMLDECKGERLEEVLCAFSAAVLKKVVQEKSSGYGAIALDLALENLSYTDEKTALSTLILAHKVSLKNAISAKNKLKANYIDFSDLLRLKDRQVTRRQEQLKVSIQEAASTQSMTKDGIRSLQDNLQENWSGSDQWLQGLLYKDTPRENDGLFTRSYDEVFAHVERGRIGEIEERQDRMGLLEQLDARVKEQSSRLEGWQRFGNNFVKSRNPEFKSPETKRNVKGLDLGLGAHEKLQLTRSPRKVFNPKAWEPVEEYNQIIINMQEKLENVSKPRRTEDSGKRQNWIEESVPSQTIVEISRDRISEGDEEDSESSDSEDQSPGPEMYESKPTATAVPSINIPDQQIKSLSVRDIRRDEVDRAVDLFPSPSQSRSTSIHSAMPPSSPLSLTTSPQASEILASMETTPPSPTKSRHVLSLAERTRMSMARLPTAHLEDFDGFELAGLPQKLQKTRQEDVAATEVGGSQEKDDQYRRQEALLERTRQSMSNSAVVAKNANLERRRSTKIPEQDKRMGDMSQKQELAGNGLDAASVVGGEGDADYEAVFKSRPKIKTSPDHSPVRVWGRMGGVNNGRGRESG